jgi:hypothetical protein
MSANAQTLVNGGFESGFSGWTRQDQAGGDGTFFLQSGTTSPVNGFPVPAPPEGVVAAMTDALGPGSHILYQDIVIPVSPSGSTLAFDIFINNQGDDFHIAGLPTLDFATPALNQQARVDLISTTADPFSVAAGDVLLNLFQTNPGDPLVSGYNTVTTDLTAFFIANAGTTVRLRFADVDNVAPFNLGIDNVRLSSAPTAVPEPSSLLLMCAGGLTLACIRRRTR